MSIIQGLALGYFADKFDHEVGKDASHFWIRMLMYALTLQMIVLTWHEYAASTICFTWPLGLLDTCIPVLLGLCECSVIKHSRTSEARVFWVWLTLFVLFAFLAFLNRERHIRNEKGNHDASILLNDELKQTKRWLVAALAAFVMATVTVYLSEANTAIILVLLVLANLSFIFQGIRCWKTYRLLFAEEAPIKS